MIVEVVGLRLLASSGRVRPYILRNCFFGGGLGNELESELFGSASQGSQCPLFELFFVLLLTDIRIVATTLQHSINEERHFMCGCNESFRFSEPGTDAAAISAKRAAAPE